MLGAIFLEVYTGSLMLTKKFFLVDRITSGTIGFYQGCLMVLVFFSLFPCFISIQQHQLVSLYDVNSRPSEISCRPLTAHYVNGGGRLLRTALNLHVQMSASLAAARLLVRYRSALLRASSFCHLLLIYRDFIEIQYFSYKDESSDNLIRHPLTGPTSSWTLQPEQYRQQVK